MTTIMSFATYMCTSFLVLASASTLGYVGSRGGGTSISSSFSCLLFSGLLLSLHQVHLLALLENMDTLVSAGKILLKPTHFGEISVLRR